MMKRILKPINRRDFMKASAIVGGGLAMGSFPFNLSAAATPQKGGVLRMSMARPGKTLNPILQAVNVGYLVSEMGYSSLVKLDKNMNPVPDLAESWEGTDKGKKWVFNLRKGAEYHQGGEVVADDVVATLEKILDPETASPGKKNVGPIESLKAVGRYQVEVTCSRSYAFLPQALAYTAVKIVPRKILEEKFEELSHKEYGSGPFILKEYVPGTHFFYERNPNYYEDNKPYLDGVNVFIYPEATAEVNALLTNELDVVNEVVGTQFKRLQSNKDIVARREVSGRFINTVLGCQAAPFNDPRVRKALALSLDRETILELALEGYGAVGNDTPISPAYRHYVQLPQRTQDLDQAGKLLREAGVKKGSKLTLVASHKPPLRAKFAVALKEACMEIGLDVNVQQMDHATYLKQVWTKGNFYVGFYNMQPTEDGIFNLLFTSDAAWNETKWNNKAFDQLVAQAQSELDPDKQKGIYKKCQEMMYEEVPTLIPVFLDLLAGHSNKVHNFTLHPRGAFWFMENCWMES